MKTLFLIGNAYWIEMNRAKALEFSQWFNVVCISHSPEGYEHMGRTQKTNNGNAEGVPYEFHLLPAKGSMQGGTKFVLSGLKELFIKYNPEVILIETEPWARIFWQVIGYKTLYAKAARIGLFSWENIRRPGLKGLILDQVYRVAGWNLDFVIGGNREAKALFEAGGVPSEKIHIDAQLGFAPEQIPSDLEGNRASLRKSWQSPNEAIIIGFCGRFVKQKGIFELIEAVQRLGEERKEKIELHLLGGGKLEGELSFLAAQKKWIKILKPVPNDKVVSIMAAWDIFVLPSKRHEEGGELWEEQFGHVLLNAMGAGCLTLGSRSGAIPEVLGDDKEVIFNPGKASSIYTLINSYLDDRGKWEFKVEKQKVRACEYYSFSAITKRYYEHMKKCGVVS